MICNTVEHGVASPIMNNEPPPMCYIRNATGILTRKAPTIPWIMTNFVHEIPLKKPIKQNRKQVSRQSIAYAFR